MTKVKLCGLMRMQDASAANEAAPDVAGMILSPGFRRSVSRDTAKQIRETLHRNIALCGVFVNASVEEIGSYLKEGLIDMVQLHGTEDDSFIDALRSAYPKTVIIKAFVIRSLQDIRHAEASHADFILLDGGTGEGAAFDHSLLSGIRRDYMLAGGLKSETVAPLVRRTRPWGVDTSSGIETDGQKDPEKMMAFVKNVRTEDSRV